ncbi:amino acid racemase [Roseateles sp. SL47]|uniref:aspartate/glutamate racemase family protein n=1 Tax=Roseateles sp. SL47 TaxID=2995138 RepID=UPI00226F6462|nr:amino acid racemase [Roseateles sp. SL47]WAC71640.1 amino acid racemase [Roseateles sp. SL47]
MQFNHPECRFGIVGGLGTLGPADLFFKLAQALPAAPGHGQTGLIFEQRPFHEGVQPGAATASQSGRMLYVFDLLRSFEARGAQSVLLPCFLSHTFLDELKAEVGVPIVDMMAAIRDDIVRRHPGARRIGVLTSDYVRARQLFERYFHPSDWRIVYPDEQVQAECVMGAIYGPEGLKTGHLSARSVDLLASACAHLVRQEVDLIVPGFSEIPVVIDALRGRGFPVFDTNHAYVRAAMAQETGASRPIKVGVVGGVGPAATVDFLGKLVKNTPAEKDQDHIKVVVEQNPQIPDRTENLVRGGSDPTVSLYATCKRLEAADAALIAIPCNTAHAFVERIQPYLSIPIISMLETTAEHLRSHLPAGGKVGLLATSGTVQSGIYAEAIVRVGLDLLIPDAEHQEQVMGAIYGPEGVKAGFTAGLCAQQLDTALRHLVERGAQAVILGCTELPLVVAANEALTVGGRLIRVVDPTELLARRCVRLAMEERA